MSHAATKWAFDQPEMFLDMKPGEWAVLMVLADCHNPVLGCFPSQDYICKRTNLSDRGVRDQLGRLRDRGLITWAENWQKGHRAENRYGLAFEADFIPANSAASQTGKTEQVIPAESDSPNRQNPPPSMEEPVTEEPVKEPRERDARARADHEAGKDDSAFEKDFADLRKRWDEIALNNLIRVREAFVRLKASERGEFLSAVPAFIAFHRSKTKAKLPPLELVLADGRWRDVPKDFRPPAKAGDPAPAGKAWADAFGRAWWWLFADFVERNRAAFLDRNSAAAFELRKRVDVAEQRAGGWPLGSDALPAVEDKAAALVPLRKDSAEAEAWRRHYSRLGIRMPTPDKAEWIFMPGNEPPPDTGREAAAIMEGTGR